MSLELRVAGRGTTREEVQNGKDGARKRIGGRPGMGKNDRREGVDWTVYRVSVGP